MSKKDYVEIARMLANHRDGVDPVVYSRMVADFADWLFKDSPQFDTVRFINAAYALPKSGLVVEDTDAS